MAASFYSLIFVLAGLFGRALTDKLLAAKGGAVTVAGWAQIASVSDVVSGVSLTGIGTALTVLAAGRPGFERYVWMKPALVMGLALSLAAALAGEFLLPARALLPTEAGLFHSALLAGWLAVAPGLLVALLIGTGGAGRATLVIVLGLLPPLAFLLAAPLASPLANLLAGQIAFGLVALAGLLHFLRSQPPLSRDSLAALLRFVPAGLAIGILSPASMAWARSEIAASLSWHAAGQVQAIWRSTDWITAIMAGVLNAHFLPRLSAARGREAFLGELRRAAASTVLPTLGLLLGLWLFLPEVLALLYREDMRMEREDALFFLLGDGIRVMSWVLLFGLFARHQAWAITYGEFLSLPLFALLLTLFAGHFGLQQAGGLWAATYLVYAAFNAAALWWSLRHS
ncbi:MAG: hypothetical protein PHU46_11110 [Rhodocyclaceae bacterium]|nr:hypothetical protein [Rhodocyclaceae bacterium]